MLGGPGLEWIPLATRVNRCGLDIHQAGAAPGTFDQVVDVALVQGAIAISHGPFHRTGDDAVLCPHAVDSALAEQVWVRHGPSFHGWRYKRSNGFARVCQRQACDHFDAKGMCTSYVPKRSRGGARSRIGKRKNENLLTLGTVLVHLLQVARQRAKPPARAF